MNGEAGRAVTVSSESDNAVTLGRSLVSLGLPLATSHICQRHIITHPHLVGAED